MRPHRAAFTLVELLVVITIIAILIALVVGVAPGILKKGNQTKSLNNMRQIASGFMLYANDNNGRLPNRPVDGDGSNRWPFLVNEYLTDPKVFAAPDDPSNYITRKSDPVSNSVNNTSYIMNGGLDPGRDQAGAAEKPLVLASLDKPSQTILLGLIFNDPNFFLDVANGDESLIDTDLFAGSNNYVFMDGSARAITDKEYERLNSTEGSAAYLWLIDKDAR